MLGVQEGVGTGSLTPLSLTRAVGRLVVVPDVEVYLPGTVGLALYDPYRLAPVLGWLPAPPWDQRNCVSASGERPAPGNLKLKHVLGHLLD